LPVGRALLGVAAKPAKLNAPRSNAVAIKVQAAIPREVKMPDSELVFFCISVRI
jgi:hypothetical protein